MDILVTVDFLVTAVTADCQAILDTADCLVTLDTQEFLDGQAQLVSQEHNLIGLRIPLPVSLRIIIYLQHQKLQPKLHLAPLPTITQF